MYQKDGTSLWYHLNAPDGSHDVISTEIVRQIAYKISDFEYPFSPSNGMLCGKESYPLLLECFIIFIWCTTKVGNASDTKYELLMVHMVSFLLGRTLKLQTKCQILGTLSAQEIGWCTCNERHSLLLKCCVPFLRCIRKMRWVSASIYKPFMVHSVSFSPRMTLKLLSKYKILGTPAALRMEWYIVRRYIHCHWIVS